MNDFEKKFEEEFNKQKQEVQKPNIVVVGGTGVGKKAPLLTGFLDMISRLSERANP